MEPVFKDSASQYLSEWCAAKYGRAHNIFRFDFVLDPPSVSRMRSGQKPIRLDHAWRLHFATKGELIPSKLCWYQEDVDLCLTLQGMLGIS